MNFSKKNLFFPMFYAALNANAASLAPATPLLTSPIDDVSIYSGAAITMGANTTINGAGHIQAAESTYLGASVTVNGNATAGTDLTLGDATIVKVDATGATRTVVIGAHAKVLGDAKAGTSVTVSASGSVEGSVLESSVTKFDTDANKSQLKQIQARLSAEVAPSENELTVTMPEDRTLKAGVYHAANLTTTAGITLTFDGEGKDGNWLINSDTYIALGAGIKMILKDVTPDSTITWNSQGYISIGKAGVNPRTEVLGTFFASSYISTGAVVLLKGIDNRCGGLFTTNGYITLGADNTIGAPGCTLTLPTNPDYFSVSHDTQGIHCAAEPVSITAKNADGSTTTDYTGTITLDTQTGTGSWRLPTGSGNFVDTTANDGLATYTFVASDNGQASFELDYTEGTPTLNIDVYDDTIRDDDLESDITFSASGFTVTESALSNPTLNPINKLISTKTAGALFNVHLAAYGTTAADPQCGIIESYTGSKNLILTTNYINPSNGSVAATGGGVVVFTNGQALVNTQYKDTGKVQLIMSDSDTSISGSSGNFVVKPASLNIELSGTNQHADDHQGSVYKAAGSDFTLTVTARDYEGDTTPNFGNEDIAVIPALTHSLYLPDSGVEGVLNGELSRKTNPAEFTGSFNWSEVGIIHLSTSISDYLGAVDADVSSTLNNVGRFTPAKLVIEIIDNGTFTSANTKGIEDFTYVGQAFSYGIAPSFRVTAQNESSNTTLNYTDVWGKLSANSITFTGPSSDSDQNGKDASTLMALTYNQGLAGFLDDAIDADQPRAVNGIFNVTFTDDDFTYEKDSNSEISPFNPNVNLVITNVVDLDGISTGAFTLNPTGTEPIRFGKMQMYDANGLELSPLVMNYRLEYFDSNHWVLHDDQNSYVAIEDITSDRAGTSASSMSPSSPLGKFGITLLPPGEGNGGAYKITTNLLKSGLPWLQYDWDYDSHFDDNPDGTATFGQYSGGAKSIYIQQIIRQ
jgi:serine acetyltransferase